MSNNQAYPTPTNRQAAVLRSLDSYPAHLVGAHVVHITSGDAPAMMDATYATAHDHGWAEVIESGRIILTEYGRDCVQNREDQNVGESGKPASHRIIISPRPLGGSSVRRWGGRRVGRNINCSTCYVNGKEEYERRQAEGDMNHIAPTYSDPVWFTNESGADADAKREAGRHYRLHVTGELPPLRY